MVSNVNYDLDSPSPSTQASALESSEAAQAFLISESSRLCAAAVRNGPRAIVLTGSMSRGEATFSREGMGWRVLGDATFLLILDRDAKFSTAELEAEIERILIAQRIKCRIVIVTSTASALSRMKPSIYAYELRERGIVVWGDHSVQRLMPRFSAAEIPREDGWWLLCNRMIEQLESASQSEGRHDNAAAVRYRIAKLYLAMAACYLLVNGQYEPSYEERAKRLQELARSQSPQPSPIPMRRFAQLVSECTHLKLKGDISGAVQFPRWCDAVSDAEAMWSWALGRVLGSDPCVGRAALLQQLAKRQSLFTRAKGWLRAAYVQPAAFRRNLHRWARLACVASPRYLVYGAASDLFFAGLETDVITHNRLAEITAKLPLTPLIGDQQLSWDMVAMMIARNFHCFVDSTRT